MSRYFRSLKQKRNPRTLMKEWNQSFTQQLLDAGIVPQTFSQAPRAPKTSRLHRNSRQSRSRSSLTLTKQPHSARGHHRNRKEITLADLQRRRRQRMRQRGPPTYEQTLHDHCREGTLPCQMCHKEQGTWECMDCPELHRRTCEDCFDIHHERESRADHVCHRIAFPNEGNIAMVMKCVSKGDNINEQDNHGFTPLMYASRANHVNIVKFLVHIGANMNIQNKYGKTALMIASAYGHMEILKFLVERGADLELKNKRKQTALTLAMLNGHRSCVAYLSKQGATLQIRMRNVCSIDLHKAFQEGLDERKKLRMDTANNPDNSNNGDDTTKTYDNDNVDQSGQISDNNTSHSKSKERIITSLAYTETLFPSWSMDAASATGRYTVQNNNPRQAFPFQQTALQQQPHQHQNQYQLHRPYPYSVSYPYPYLHTQQQPHLYPPQFIAQQQQQQQHFVPANGYETDNSHYARPPTQANTGSTMPAAYSSYQNQHEFSDHSSTSSSSSSSSSSATRNTPVEDKYARYSTVKHHNSDEGSAKATLESSQINYTQVPVSILSQDSTKYKTSTGHHHSSGTSSLSSFSSFPSSSLNSSSGFLPQLNLSRNKMGHHATSSTNHSINTDSNSNINSDNNTTNNNVNNYHNHNHNHHRPTQYYAAGLSPVPYPQYLTPDMTSLAQATLNGGVNEPQIKKSTK